MPSLKVRAVLCAAQGSARPAPPRSLSLGREAQAERLTGRRGGNATPLDTENLRGRKTAIWAKFGQIRIFGLVSEKPGSLLAVSGPISPARRRGRGAQT